MLIFTLVVLGLHCYALHKWIEFHKGTIDRLLVERHDMIQACKEFQNKTKGEEVTK